MPDDEMTSNDEAIELSDDQLDDIAGGLSFQLKAAKSSFRSFSKAPGTHACGSAQPAVQSESLDAALLELTVVDATTEDLKIISKLLGGADALDGD